MNVALIAHDNKKILMENLCIAYRHILARHSLYATGTTGRLISECTGLYVRKYLAGHLGGDEQIGSQITYNEIDVVIFLNDPTSPENYEPRAGYITRLCHMHNIPLATNLATAEALLLALDRGDLDWREVLK